ncbi:two-partner secretion domain-containing protein [Haemophilus influenzae]|uniref:two-partner secretion domain-containing protein n=1 Tax=Haemophilus influenzae TaxID=727 RepID=UPI0007666117|nr:filamentous hemagglutinin N-terminal domain-containing protein [Haemophilus influenzae]CWW97980.1 HMW2A%2C high molecular weight adhesin 2 [Haemophilus influenzae]CWX47006.1 HMW2A%2C high molecular weight adhesin 2 [Haemophilus influenzae]
MNKIYRLKFSKRLNALVAVSELARGCDHSTEKGSEKPARMKVRHLALKPLSAILLSLGVTSIPQSVLASGLQGMDVVHGTATMQVDGNKTIIRNSVDAIINWKQFNIDQNEMVQFLQENNNSAVFNRVTSNQISQLKGILDSNGQVFLINPNGVAIGKNAIINTNGFTASTLDISNENIKARNFTFEQTKDKALAEIVNHGLITVGKDGSVNLIGGKVKNEGVISVNGGSISLLAGQKITISDIINPTITYSIAAPENEAINLGDIFAKGGNINVRAANIRNQGKLSADSASKDKSGNIVLSAKEGEAEIGGVISAQNQQAKGGKLMITGDKVTLKTGAVIDLSGKEGGETYLGGDERGEGKNGIQLAKKTTLEKGSTINVSGKEKGGRAIVWGDIALIDGNINAQGSGDIAKTGGFVETSGHYLSIGDDAIVDAKEWLLDPDDINIVNGSNIDAQLQPGRGDTPNKVSAEGLTSINNATLSTALQKGIEVNISATKNVTVNADVDVKNGTLVLHSQRNGVKINGNITSTQNGNLTIKTGGKVDVHKNITLGMGFLNITSDNNITFEKGDNLTITAQGNIISNQENKQLRFSNVSLNGMGAGLTFTANKGNHTHKFDGTLNISGKVVINQTTPHNIAPWNASADSYWNVTTLTLGNNAQFTFIKFVDSNRSVALNGGSRSFAGVKFYGKNNEMKFNIGDNANVEFKLKSNDNTSNNKPLPIQFLSNISATGNGTVSFDIHANLSARSTELNMSLINISNGVNFSINSHVRGNNAFEIKKDLIINATGSNFNLKQTKDKFDNSYEKNAIFSTHNLTILGGNVTLGGENSSSNIKGNININSKANVTLQAHAGTSHLDKKERTLTLGNVSVGGNLNIIGSNAHIDGNLSIAESAKFQGKTNNNLNITGTFTNNGTADINIKQGVVKLQGDITNNGNLNITTNASVNQKTIINGNITNKKGDLNIKDIKANAEIQIGGNISQKEGNLTISSDKINITKRIEIKADTDQGNSDSGVASNANLTIKTKELTLTDNLNISGFNKAEITAKDNSDLIIGKASSDNSNAKQITFDKVKDSKISAGNHNVTLNSKVETSNSDGSTGNGSDDNNIGLTISAKDVTVNSNITSHKTVNISASEGGITTKAGTTINATTGSVEVTAKTGDISGTISGKTVSVTATTDSLTVKSGAKINATEGTATLTASSGKLTTEANSAISGANGVTASSQSGDISGTISGKTVSVTASSGSLTVGGDAKINATKGAATLTATKGTLTTVKGSNIDANEGTLVINAQDATLNGDASGDRTEVNAVNASGSGNVTAKTSSSVNITGDLSTINGLNIISKNGKNTVVLKGAEIDVKYIQPGVASANEVIEAKRALEKVKDLSDEERETLAKLGVSAVRFIEPNNTITVNTQNEFTTRPSSQVTISEGKACFSSGNGAAVCTNVADDGQQ